MQEEILIPAIIFFSIFGYLAWRRYLEFKETVALAEKGLVKPRGPSDGRDALRWGIVITALGLALCIGLYPVAWLIDGQMRQFPLGFGPWMLLGLVPLFFGLGLILIYLVTRRENAAAERAEAAAAAMASPAGPALTPPPAAGPAPAAWAYPPPAEEPPPPLT